MNVGSLSRYVVVFLWAIALVGCSAAQEGAGSEKSPVSVGSPPGGASEQKVGNDECDAVYKQWVSASRRAASGDIRAMQDQAQLEVARAMIGGCLDAWPDSRGKTSQAAPAADAASPAAEPAAPPADPAGASFPMAAAAADAPSSAQGNYVSPNGLTPEVESAIRSIQGMSGISDVAWGGSRFIVRSQNQYKSAQSEICPKLMGYAEPLKAGVLVNYPDGNGGSMSVVCRSRAEVEEQARRDELARMEQDRRKLEEERAALAEERRRIESEKQEDARKKEIERRRNEIVAANCQEQFNILQERLRVETGNGLDFRRRSEAQTRYNEGLYKLQQSGCRLGQ